jgi:protoporphyrinogen IX oxidase
MYLWLKSLHVIAVMSWMAGLLYLPRLMVYHCDAAKGSELSETLKVMERRLLVYIMRPAMIVSWILGLWMIFGYLGLKGNIWLHFKLLFVVLLTVCHAFLAVRVKDFAMDQNTRPQRYFRIINEVPTLLMIGIVILVIVKPF